MNPQDFPPRLSESSSDSRITTALEVAKSYEPPPERMLAALGQLEASRGAVPSPGATLRGSMFPAKVGALAAIVLVIGAGWSVTHLSGGEAASNPAPGAAPAATVAERSPSTESAPPAEAMTMRVEELPSATAPAAPASPEKSRTAPKPATAAAFDDELALIESARTALARGDATACLAQLDRYEQRIHGGVFEREVAVMRIEALAARGETSRARSLGEAFLTQSPQSPYASRIRSLLARLPAQSTKAP